MKTIPVYWGSGVARRQIGTAEVEGDRLPAILKITHPGAIEAMVNGDDLGALSIEEKA